MLRNYLVLELCKRQGNGQFIRKGIVGDWMNHFTPELNKVTLNFITYCHNCMYVYMNSSALFERNIIHEFFSPQQEYNNWIRENLDRIGITDETVRSYFTLDVEF